MKPALALFHRPRWLALAALFGLTLLMFGDVLVTRRDVVLSSSECDLASQFIYWRGFSAEQLRQGAGHHHLRLEYWPQAFRLGLSISA